MAPLRYAVHMLPDVLIAVRQAEDPDDLSFFAPLDPRLDLLADDMAWWMRALAIGAGRRRVDQVAHGRHPHSANDSRAEPSRSARLHELGRRGCWTSTPSWRCSPTAASGASPQCCRTSGSGAVIMQRRLEDVQAGQRDARRLRARRCGTNGTPRRRRPRPTTRWPPTSACSRRSSRWTRASGRASTFPFGPLSPSASTRSSACASTSTRSTPGTSRSSSTTTPASHRRGRGRRRQPRPHRSLHGRADGEERDRPGAHHRPGAPLHRPPDRPTRAELPPATPGSEPDLVLPAESFCRLVYGRLDPDHTPGLHRRRRAARHVAPGVPGSLSLPTEAGSRPGVTAGARARRGSAGHAADGPVTRCRDPTRGARAGS